jgi:methylglutaconyl-CoA hydratase
VDTIDIKLDTSGIARLTLARPEKHNAMNARMIAELTEAAAQLDQAKDVRVVILAGQGKSFCAGGDLDWMRDQMQADGKTRRIEATKLAMMLNALNQLSKPLIGAVHGNCFGGGVGLVSVCDIAVCADHVRFGLTETRLGLIPATIGPYVVARLGEAAARRVFMSARLFNASEAVDLGVVAQSCAVDALDEAVMAQARPYLEAAPGAVAAAKALVRTLGGTVDETQIAESIDALVERWESQEAAEGIAAFFEKRKPNWSG